MALPDLLTRLSARAEPLRAALARWRTPIVAAALVLFLAGTVWSFLGLGLTLERIDLAALVVLTLGMGLVTLAYSAVSLMLLAKTAGARLGFGAALRASARAQMAEALPLPGGAIVRTATLVGAGIPAGRSAALVIGTALLWIVGIRLPGLNFENQKVEAALRKELVYGEDEAGRADPPSFTQLFANVQKNYFRLYFHYTYFNLARYAYLQVAGYVPLLSLATSQCSGVRQSAESVSSRMQSISLGRRS